MGPSPRSASTLIALELCFLLTCSSRLLAGEEPAVPKSWSVRWQPTRPVNGSPVVFQVVPPAPVESLSGQWLEHDVYFSFDPRTKTWYGLAGISLEATPRTYPLSLKGATAKGRTFSFDRKVTVRRAKYPSITVTVARKYTEPDPEQLKRINEEKTLKQDLFRRTEPEREWSGGFRAPVMARVSDVFGTERTFNGKVQSRHQGLDYAVPPGTPVSALNSGTVLLARDLFFEGNCVVLDHGQGLLTLYLHLSELKVKEGDRVERGQQLGLSGGTGRTTGPHLHIAVRWQGVYVNPGTLLSLKLP